MLTVSYKYLMLCDCSHSLALSHLSFILLLLHPLYAAQSHSLTYDFGFRSVTHRFSFTTGASVWAVDWNSPLDPSGLASLKAEIPPPH